MAHINCQHICYVICMQKIRQRTACCFVVTMCVFMLMALDRLFLESVQVIVQTGMWSFLVVAKNMCAPRYSQLAYLHHGSPAWNVGPFCTIAVPIVRMTTVHLKLPYIAKFSQILRIDHVCKGRGLRDELLSLCLEVEAILVLRNLADSIAKSYSRTFLPAICKIISSRKFCNI